MKILILSDFSSKSPGGAQVITNLFAQVLREKEFDVFEVSMNPNPRINSFGKRLLTNSNFLRELRGLINPLALISLQKQIRKIKPDMIWIHNINNYWSWSSLLLCKLNAKTILTCHELSAISNLKLRKNNLDSDSKLKYDSLNMSRATILLLRIKHLYVRILFKSVSAVAIGEICQDVLKANHFRIITRIPNRVEACNHDSNISREPGTVLFAGRLIEKGLEETALGVMQAGMRLILIGPPELYRQATQFCPAEKVEYLGNKSNQELLLLLHKFEIVSICSQSFDNYPTIGLEAIVHGCKVVTTEVTGLSRLLERYGINATLPVGQIPDFLEIQKIPNNLFLNQKLIREVTDPAITVESYLDLLR